MVKKKEPKVISRYLLWALFDHAVFPISRLRQIELEQYGLTIAQAAILHKIQLEGGMVTLQQLERDLLRQHHSISTLINRMAQMTLIRKSKYQDDSRYKISVTEEGKKIAHKITNVSLEMAFSVLSEKQKLEFANILFLLEKSTRSLLNTSQTASFLQYLKKKSNEEDTKGLEEITDFDLWGLIHGVGFALTRLFELELANIGLTTPQVSILSFVNRNGGKITFKELEANRMRQHHSIFLLLNRMSKMKLIKQVKNQQSQRNLIVLTQEGKERFDKITTISLDMSFSVLSPEQEEKLVEYLKTLAKRTRHLLGVSYLSPFLKYLIYGNITKKD